MHPTGPSREAELIHDSDIEEAEYCACANCRAVDGCPKFICVQCGERNCVAGDGTADGALNKDCCAQRFLPITFVARERAFFALGFLG